MKEKDNQHCKFTIGTPCKTYSWGEVKYGGYLEDSEKFDFWFSNNRCSSFTGYSKHFDILINLLYVLLLYAIATLHTVSEFTETGEELWLNWHRPCRCPQLGCQVLGTVIFGRTIDLDLIQTSLACHNLRVTVKAKRHTCQDLHTCRCLYRTRMQGWFLKVRWRILKVTFILLKEFLKCAGYTTVWVSKGSFTTKSSTFWLPD